MDYKRPYWDLAPCHICSLANPLTSYPLTSVNATSKNAHGQKPHIGEVNLRPQRKFHLINFILPSHNVKSFCIVI